MWQQMRSMAFQEASGRGARVTWILPHSIHAGQARATHLRSSASSTRAMALPAVRTIAVATFSTQLVTESDQMPQAER